MFKKFVQKNFVRIFRSLITRFEKYRCWASKIVLVQRNFCESGEGVRLPRARGDLRGSPGNFRGSPGNFWGSLGNFRGSPGLLLSYTVREIPGEVAEKFPGKSPGNFREVRGLSRSSGRLTPSQQHAKVVSNSYLVTVGKSSHLGSGSEQL